MNATERLDAEARAILCGNDRGGFTIPTAGLYPYQWNWDSVFVALGFMTFDEPRAWAEIDSLFQAQWPDGMVPHIVFRRDDPDYFPGPDVWGTGDLGLKWPTSGLSQPPVAATAVSWMVDRAKDGPTALSQARALLPRLDAWHAWWHRARDPEGLGIMAITHPWESGRDNLPDWDRPGEAIDVSGVGTYTRRDTGHVDPAMRPTKTDYDRYIALVQLGRQWQWNPETIAEKNPFWVADVGVTLILLRAERDLLALATRLGDKDVASATRARIARMERGFERLWNEKAGAYCSLDLRSGLRAEAATAATFLCFYAGVGERDRREQLLGLAERWADAVSFMCPSFDPAHPAFDAMRYWRGPVWAIVNLMMATGLAEAGHTPLSDRIIDDTRRLMELTGFAECYNPLNGRAAGGIAFSWAAAVWLAWVSPTASTG